MKYLSVKLNSSYPIDEQWDDLPAGFPREVFEFDSYDEAVAHDVYAIVMDHEEFIEYKKQYEIQCAEALLKRKKAVSQPESPKSNLMKWLSAGLVAAGAASAAGYALLR